MSETVSDKMAPNPAEEVTSMPPAELTKRLALLEEQLKALTEYVDTVKLKDQNASDDSQWEDESDRENDSKDDSDPSKPNDTSEEDSKKEEDEEKEKKEESKRKKIDEDKISWRYRVNYVVGVKEYYKWKDFQTKEQNENQTVDAPSIEAYFPRSSRATKTGVSSTAAGGQLKQPLAIRINSWVLMEMMHNLGLPFTPDLDPVYMTRPFKWLSTFEDKIRASVKSLEARFEAGADASGADTNVADTNGTENNGVDANGTNTTSGVDASEEPETSAEPIKPSLRTSTIGISSPITANHEQDAITADKFEASSFGSLFNKLKEVEVLGCVCQECVVNEFRRNLTVDTFTNADGLKELKCLLEFIDKYITPKKALSVGEPSTTAVNFEDLWYIFKPGVDICTETYRDQVIYGDPVSLSTQGRQDHTLWRVLNRSGGHWEPSGMNKSEDSNDSSGGKYYPLNIRAYSIDFNGSMYGAVYCDFTILPFKGIREISSLPVSPLNWIKNGSEVKDTLRKHAAILEKYNKKHKFKHQYYEGRAFSIRFDLTRPPDCDMICSLEDVDSPVIIDIPMALQTHPEWVRPMGVVEFMPDSPDADDEGWPNGEARFKIRKSKEAGQEQGKELDDVKCYLVGNSDKEIAYDPIDLKQPGSTFDIREPSENFNSLSEDDYVLLPSKIFAYVLRSRKFALVEMKELAELPENETSFKNLIIRREYKDTVQALVENHFRRKEFRRREDLENENTFLPEIFDNDIIRGKGRGLMILLHGAPGVGKTSTAECVAAKFRKPLLPITCADLGLSAQTVEAALDNMFKLAYRWDCVLLLDEADVFLTSRKPSDIERNILVSVFLRVLEYYRGILFLTTNRVGHFDAAFKSRMHVILHYPPLDENQTALIWKMNMRRTTWNETRPISDSKSSKILIECEKAEEDAILRLAAAHFQKNRATNQIWNARQIRNAFRTAIAIAEFRHKTKSAKTSSQADSSSRPKLREEDFSQVMKMSKDFDEYLKQTHGNVTESDIALKRGERMDEFESDEEVSYNPPPVNPQRSSMQSQYGTPQRQRPQQRYEQQPQPGKLRPSPGQVPTGRISPRRPPAQMPSPSQSTSNPYYDEEPVYTPEYRSNNGYQNNRRPDVDQPPQIATNGQAYDDDEYDEYD